jgi:hypothetical protein
MIVLPPACHAGMIVMIPALDDPCAIPKTDHGVSIIELISRRTDRLAFDHPRPLAVHG